MARTNKAKPNRLARYYARKKAEDKARAEALHESDAIDDAGLTVVILPCHCDPNSLCLIPCCC
jgi:hypothetical protein